MKNYSIICKFSIFAGFFKKRVVGENLCVFVKDNNKDFVFVIQFFHKLKEEEYIAAIVTSFVSHDDDTLEFTMEGARTDGTIEIFEDRLPTKVSYEGGKVKLTFTKPSKYLGKSLDLYPDNRFPRGYYLAKCKTKKGYEPIVRFEKINDDAINIDGNKVDLGLIKKMRAFTTSRLKKFTKT